MKQSQKGGLVDSEDMYRANSIHAEYPFSEFIGMNFSLLLNGIHKPKRLQKRRFN